LAIYYLELWNTTDLYIGGRGAFLTLPLSSIGYMENLVEIHHLQGVDHTPLSLALDPHDERLVYTQGQAIIMVEWDNTAQE